jgi:hypothetical protein
MKNSYRPVKCVNGLFNSRAAHSYIFSETAESFYDKNCKKSNATLHNTSPNCKSQSIFRKIYTNLLKGGKTYVCTVFIDKLCFFAIGCHLPQVIGTVLFSRSSVLTGASSRQVKMYSYVKKDS